MHGTSRHADRGARAILMVDVVESVRLMEADEDGTIARWFRQLEHLKNNVLPTFNGSLVKSLGDGVLLSFDDAQAAVSAGFAIHRHSNRENRGVDPDRQIVLRMGAEFSDVVIEQGDVFGHGVNVADRLTGLAGPGEIVVSEHIRERLTPVLDGDIEDLGPCYLKHIRHPVRVFRVGPPGPRPIVRPAFSPRDLLPSMAIIPFRTIRQQSEHDALGEILAEEIIMELSRSPDLDVISRLSTTALRWRDLTLDEICAHLNADYVLSGIYEVEGDHIRLDAELSEGKSGRIAWTKQFRERCSAIIDHDQELIWQIVSEIKSAVRSRELERVRSQSVPTLKSYSLLIAAVELMHRLSLRDFDEARHLLEAVIDRAKRQAVPQAWLAKWYVLRVQQGWSPDPQQDAIMASQHVRQALDADPECSLALAMDGLVQTHMQKDLGAALKRYELALAVSPSSSLAWLLKGTLHAFRGEGETAVQDTQRALRLTPLDPHRWYFDSLAGTACLAARQYEAALDLATASLRANRMHTSTLRVITIAQCRLGRLEEARETARELMRLEPTLTIGRYLARSPAEHFETGKDWSEALREAGVPA